MLAVRRKMGGGGDKGKYSREYKKEKIKKTVRTSNIMIINNIR